MLHKHHATEHLVLFLLGVFLLGGTIGGISGLMGNDVLHRSDALGVKDIRDFLSGENRERLEKGALNRKVRREKRLQKEERVISDVGATYPMHTQTFSFKGTTQWDVALNTGMLSYGRLGISVPLGRPSITNWKNRNWRALEDQMQYLLMNGTAIYPHSPEFGEEGSFIVAGHSSAPTMESIGNPYTEAFAKLPEAKAGDLISLTDAKGNSYLYTVRKAQVVPSTYTKILLQDPSKKELVIFTCYPVGTTRDRFVVWADLLEGGELAAK